MFMTSTPSSRSVALSTASAATFGRSRCDATVHAAFPSFTAVDTVDVEPEAVQKASPSYPDAAREANVSGVVRMKVLVCEHGRVVDARVVGSVPALDQAALDAVAQWRFTPAMHAARPVSHWTAVPMRFTLN